MNKFLRIVAVLAIGGATLAAGAALGLVPAGLLVAGWSFVAAVQIAAE